MKTSNNVRDIQEVVLQIFKIVKKICDDNDIRYFAIAGTAIGAVRHKGFIPWDDDMDIAIPRDDLEKFIRIAPDLLPEKYKLTGMFNTNGSVDGVVRVNDTTTTRVDLNRINKSEIYSGIFLDIMPLDGVPTNVIAFIVYMNTLSIIFKLSRIRNNGFRQVGGTMSWRLLKTFIFIFSLILPSKVYINAYLSLVKKYKFDDNKTKYLSRTWAFNTHDGMKAKSRYFKEDFSKYIEMPFENAIIRMPNGYDRYLSGLYPNYMKPPLKSMQQPHNNKGLTDTERSYKYYLARKGDKIIGYTAGCYDMFHIGHLNLLRRAKNNCDYLIVGVNSDDAAFSYKHKYPVIPLEERMDILRELKCVDEVVRVDNVDKFFAYGKYQYDVIFVGNDHKNEKKWKDLEKKLSRHKSRVCYFPYTQHTSSTKLRKVLDDIIENSERKKYTAS